jgi:hypothetical protein
MMPIGLTLYAPFTQESRTTLIGCAESVPARKYKITRNPLKGALLISEVV